jgi:hypothetical protein
MEVQQPAEHNGLGDGLHNLMHAYQGEDGGDSDSDNSLGNMFLLEDVNMLNPNEAHLQIGMARTHFYPIDVEITQSFSREGMEIWEKYFAPHIRHPNENMGKIFHIPVSWFSFITLMLMTPKKFDWTVHFLNSSL